MWDDLKQTACEQEVVVGEHILLKFPAISETCGLLTGRGTTAEQVLTNGGANNTNMWILTRMCSQLLFQMCNQT